LAEQLGGWADAGIRFVKMKIGRDPAADPHRVAVARKAIGDLVELFVDANGAYTRKQALAMAERLVGESDIRWFEEPVSSDDLPGLNLLRDRAPDAVQIAAGEYGYTPGYFRRMLEAQAVDCLQADATRCGGYTGFLKAAALCEAFHMPLSAHCAPQMHAHVGCCCQPLQHIENFHDHVRIVPLLFENFLEPVDGRLAPRPEKNGHGLRLRRDSARFAVP
jgi:L-alanine-DL-glutamate epimerase-like enolase superfamily enzyme